MSTPHPVQFKGSALARAVLRLMGWRVVFEGLPSLQGVAVVYPHTSNWDFIAGMLAKWAIGIPAHFWAKNSLFKVPVFGRWLRRVGGLPIDRSAANGAVGQMVDTFRQHERKGACSGWVWPPRARASARLAGAVAFIRWRWARACRWASCGSTGAGASCVLWTFSP